MKTLVSMMMSAIVPGLGGCAGAPATAPRTYEAVVRARLVAARAERSFLLRHNPTDCSCPPFELLVASVSDVPGVEAKPIWQRVEMTGVDETGEELATLREHVARQSLSGTRDRARFRIEGRLEGRLGTCGRGMFYLFFVPSAVELVVEEAPEPVGPR
jgi:hypothetical protein